MIINNNNIKINKSKLDLFNVIINNINNVYNIKKSWRLIFINYTTF